VSLVLCLGAGAGESGACLMAAVPQAEAGESTSHGCCGTGLTAQPPACCHAGPGSTAPAALETATRTTAPASSTLVHVRPSTNHVIGSASLPTSRSASHSPPLSILRI
jgi:hypothetical protein